MALPQETHTPKITTPPPHMRQPLIQPRLGHDPCFMQQLQQPMQLYIHPEPQNAVQTSPALRVPLTPPPPNK
eukprot:8217041-Ditylum_brightwellii.AAC.1